MTSPLVENADVVIVGARLAGCAAAIRYAQAGARVVAIDRAQFPSDTPSTHGMFSSHVAELAAIGALSKVLELKPPRTTSIQIAHGGTVVTERMSDYGGFGYGLVVGRAQLDAAVVATAREARADIRERATATGLVHDDGRVQGVRYQQGGREFQIDAPLVVGADGRRSRMAKLLDVDRPYRTSKNQRGFVWRYVPDRRSEDERSRMVISRERTLAMIGPMPEGLMVQIAIPPIEEMKAWRTDADRMWAELAHAHPFVGDLLATRDRDPDLLISAGLAPGTLRCSELTAFFRISSGPGWALAGDAGHFKDPVIGQGIRDALRSGRRLAEITTPHLDSPERLDRALAVWERERDRDCLAAYHWGNRESRTDPLLDIVFGKVLGSFEDAPADGRHLIDVFCRRWRTDQVIGVRRSAVAVAQALADAKGHRRELLRVVGREARIELDLLAERRADTFRDGRVRLTERPDWRDERSADRGRTAPDETEASGGPRAVHSLDNLRRAAKGISMIPPRPIIKIVWNAHRKVFEASKGRVGARMLGFPALGLYTHGRKSGLERLAVLLYLEDNGRYAVVGSNLGSDHAPAWWLNLQAQPKASVLIRGRRHQVVAEQATQEEFDRLFPRFVAKYKDYAAYQRRANRPIPIVLLSPIDA